MLSHKIYISSLSRAVAGASYLHPCIQHHLYLIHPSWSLHSAPLSLHPSSLCRQRCNWQSCHHTIVVNGDDSPLSSASPEVVRLPRWDDLGWSYSLNCNLLHKLILSFSFKGTVIKPSSSSSSFRACRARLRRAAWGIEGRWGISQPGHRHEILSDRFPDLGESSYEDWRSWTSAFSPGRRRRTFRDFSLRWDFSWLHMVHVGSGDPPPPEPRGAHGPPE